MPRLSSFYGIAIYMYVTDHGPPHFHAQHGGREAIVAITDGTVLQGRLAPTEMRRVRTWRRLRQGDLEAAWDRASRGLHPGTIEPLP